MKKECIFIDAFTDTPYAGNQLAVFTNGSGLSTTQMQQLAKEINYSETTFIFDAGDTEADFRVRIFTPACELPFAGHPTLGTAYAIMEVFDIWSEKGDTLRLAMRVGVIPLRKENGIIWMTQNRPEFFSQHLDKKSIAALFDLSASDIVDDLPVEEVSTGNRMLIVPIKTLGAMQRAQGNVMKMKDFFKGDLIGPYLFSLETTAPSAQIHTRFFAPHLGILEDPATGSAAGPLVGYLLKHKVFGNEFRVVNEQGVEMGRRSSIMMRGSRHDADYTIEVGGKCAFVGRGEFEI
ncbi:MAG: PhzF family phenazine biosynthesis protein [bacterium]